MKKFSYAIIVFLILGVVLSACAAPKAPTPAPTPTTPAPSTERPAAPQPQLSREQQLLQAAKAKGETEVVLWALSWRYGPVEQAFEARYPGIKLKVWDPSQDEMGNKLLAEYKAGKYTPDVVTFSTDWLVRVHEAGILQEYEWPNAKGWPHQPPHKFWVFDQLSTRLPVYNTNLVTSAEAPRKWEDLNNSKWKGKALLSTSAAGWILGFAYERGDATPQGVNWEPTIKLWKDIVKNTSPRVVGGFTGPLELVVAGDAHIMLMAAGTSSLYNIRRGAPLAVTPLPKTFGDPWSIALPKNPPHPNTARLLLDWMTSDEGSLIYSNTGPNPSVNPRIADKAWAAQYHKTLGIEIFTLPPELSTEKYFAEAGKVWRDILGR